MPLSAVCLTWPDLKFLIGQCPIDNSVEDSAMGGNSISSATRREGDDHGSLRCWVNYLLGSIQVILRPFNISR